MNDRLPQNPGAGTQVSIYDQGQAPAQPMYEPWLDQDPFGTTPTTSDGGAKFDPRSILSAVVRYKWAPIFMLILGMLASVVIYREVKPEYVAQGSIWVQRDRDTGPISSGDLLESYAWQDLLSSFEVLDPVVLQQRLYLEPAVKDEEPLFAGFTVKPTYLPGFYTLKVDTLTDAYRL